MSTNNELLTSIYNKLGIIAEKIPLGGGGGEPPTTGDLTIRFSYINENHENVTIIKRANAGEDVTYPDIPLTVPQVGRRPALVFQEWSSSALLTNVQGDIAVGAVYGTASGRSVALITITNTTGADAEDALNQVFYGNKSNTSELTMRVSGDGYSQDYTTSASGKFNIPFSVPGIGLYTVEIWISSGTGTYGFGITSTAGAIFGADVQEKKNILTAMFIGENVTNPGTGAFAYCRSLLDVMMPNSVTSIGQNIFAHCYSIRAITIPNSVTSIGSSAFSNCYSLSAVTIPAGVTSIGNSAFSNCYSLSAVTIPAGVTSLGTSAFSNCYSLIHYTFESEVPPILANINAFSGINAIAKFFVLDQSVEAYEAATNWNSFADRIDSISKKGELEWVK